MKPDFDVIVVGSGPAGVSVCFPLLEAGLSVLLVDGGRSLASSPPSVPYLRGRATDPAQWRWMIGQHFHALRNSEAVSPKLRVPIYADAFANYASANKIDASDFIVVGSLARGGLSNAWGCGVATLAPREFDAYPFAYADIRTSYERVTRRIGVSGATSDDLSGYFGLDEWADPPIPLDRLHDHILTRYSKQRSSFSSNGISLGRSRVAALSIEREGRSACDMSGNCLWGCQRKALYSATQDLERLQGWPNFSYLSGLIVDSVDRSGLLPAISGRGPSGSMAFRATKVVLAAGTLASTRLALQAIQHGEPVSMQSCPTAAFMLWAPRELGAVRAPAFGLGQLSFSMKIDEKVSTFGSLFSPTGIPVAEFAKFLPFTRRYGIDLLKVLLTSCSVGNLFFPGALSTTTLRLTKDGRLNVTGGYHDSVKELLKLSEKRLRRAFQRLGIILLPGGFAIGKPGSDIHYACSMPMRTNPAPGETDAVGAVAGMPDVHIVDGACLTSLTEKSHTLTIMANADRIGRHISSIIIPRCR